MCSTIGRVALVAIVTLASVLLEACTHTIYPPLLPPEVPRPVVEALPLTIGVHYPDEFRNATKFEPRLSQKVAPLYRNKTWEYPYGKASVDLLDASLQSMFQRIVPVQAWPPEAHRAPPVSGFIVPRAVAIDVRTISAWRPHDSYVRVTYSIELYDAQAKLVRTWMVESTQKEGSNALLANALHAAMTDATAQFVRHVLADREQVKQWLSGRAPLRNAA